MIKQVPRRGRRIKQVRRASVVLSQAVSVEFGVPRPTRVSVAVESDEEREAWRAVWSRP